MKVICTNTNYFKLDKHTITRLEKYLHYEDGELNIKINKEYSVFGILFLDNSPWYYLYIDESDETPTPYPSELFNIIDNRLSQYWNLSYTYTNGFLHTELVFKEWAQNRNLLESLLDNNPKTFQLFEEYRNLIKNEFSDNNQISNRHTNQ